MFKNLFYGLDRLDFLDIFPFIIGNIFLHLCKKTKFNMYEV